MNKPNGNRLIDTENRLMVDRGEGVERQGKKSERITKYTSIVTE